LPSRCLIDGSFALTLGVLPLDLSGEFRTTPFRAEVLGLRTVGMRVSYRTPLRGKRFCTTSWYFNLATFALLGARFLGNLALKCMRPGRLLIVSTSNESILESSPVPMIRFAFR
jgi:hypothetical protein